MEALEDFFKQLIISILKINIKFFVIVESINYMCYNQ
jgi:hypothetical protein